ncbi:MAG TPA: TIGR00730 family Rossman fold protein [Candidatus Sulfotelmatobacter sp.]|nr:TIGR00730 family Rossman fold protein [Candidatus Sulfotelmatobacter sp.]
MGAQHDLGLETKKTPRNIRRVCVFCGSSTGNRAIYAEAAEGLGAHLAGAGIGLVFGGGRVGLMGKVADAVLAGGGEAIGVIPRDLADKEIAHSSLTKLHIVGSMHERKAMMADLSDAFILLPGGFGSWEEFCEIVTWLQLGIHRKPCGVLNVAGYYDALLEQSAHAVAEGFLNAAHREMIVVGDNAAELLAGLATIELPVNAKWLPARDR